MPLSNTSICMERSIDVLRVFESEKAGSTPIVRIAISAYLSLGNGTYNTLKAKKLMSFNSITRRINLLFKLRFGGF